MQDVASGLAELINTDAFDQYTASVRGNVLVVTNRDGAAFDITVVNPASGTMTIDDTTAETTMTLSLSEVPAETDQFKVEINS